jgi:hypothetical protein
MSEDRSRKPDEKKVRYIAGENLRVKRDGESQMRKKIQRCIQEANCNIKNNMLGHVVRSNCS